MPPSPSATTRERILAVALQLFCRRGYAAVGTQEICEQAGVLKGTLYHFFPTKLDVAIAALETYGASVEKQYWDIAHAAGLPAGKLKKLFDLAEQEAQRSFDSTGAVSGCLHGNLAMELAASTPLMRNVLDAVAQRWTAAIAAMVGDRQLAITALALLHGAVLMAKISNTPSQIAHIGRKAKALLPPQKRAQTTKPGAN